MPSIARIPGLLLGASLALLSCTSPVDQAGSNLPGQCQSQQPLLGPQKTDILFVIDNSSSMEEEQAAIASELPSFVEELQRDTGVVQDFRVGVITTSVYLYAQHGTGEPRVQYFLNPGVLKAVPFTDGTLSEERFLDDEDPELVEKFRRLVIQGKLGSGQETPFEAVRLATEAPANQGFFRDGARLLVVVVSDEDDCSSTERPPPVFLANDTSRDFCTEQADALTSVEAYYETFSQLRDGKGARRPVLWAAIAPVGLASKEVGSVQDVTPGGTFVRNVDCPTSYGPGFRQKAMAERFDSQLNNLASICNNSYRQSLIDIALMANTSQQLDVMNVPDERLLQVRLTRADETVETCTTLNGGLRYEPSTDNGSARIVFQGTCARKPDDAGLVVKVLCAT